MPRLILLSLIFLFQAKSVTALNQFTTDYQISYQIQPSGQTRVKYQINQTNNLSRVYATEFSLSVSHTDIENLKVKDFTTPINPDITLTDNITNINFAFENKTVGKDKTHNFSIEYDTNDIAVKTGAVWEINIPKITAKENIDTLTVTLLVPPDFPKPVFIDPKPQKIQDNLYTFSSHSLINKPISALFGDQQYFQLNAAYHLKNELAVSAEKVIALPPNTGYQEVYLKNLDPGPKNITQDTDGNWLAVYQLKPKQELDIKLEQIIKLNFNPRPAKLEDPKRYLQSTDIWDFNSAPFQTINTRLNRPQQVFDLVTSSLIYNYSLVKKDPLSREPASFSLEHPTQAICTNFTDLFIALARKNNIPSREIQGFALSQNDKLKPLSLSQDVLHAWPEYFDSQTSSWIQVDPTWTSTTNGVDYFNKLDLNHIAFVVHGQDAVYPLPAGFYKNSTKTGKNINIKEIEPVDFPQANIKVELKEQKGNDLIISVTNLSGVAKLNFPPLSHQNQVINLKTRPFWGKSTQTVTLKIAGDQYSLPVNIKPLLSPQSLLITSTVLFVLILLIIKKIKNNNAVFPVSIKT